MADLSAGIGRFRSWASDHFPGPRFGEWDCDYTPWDDRYAAVPGQVAASPPEAWSDEELPAVLYASARDNGGEHLAEEIGRSHPATLVAPAEAALIRGEPDARWQPAAPRGHLGPAGDEAERLLPSPASDAADYVRRRALGASVRVGPPAVERRAPDAWHRQDEHQEGARTDGFGLPPSDRPTAPRTTTGRGRAG